mgnify:CR=1 FL=1
MFVVAICVLEIIFAFLVQAIVPWFNFSGVAFRSAFLLLYNLKEFYIEEYIP